MDESYAHFVRHFGKPAGFSSPGFYSDERVMRLLDRLGFLYNGDGIGGEPRPATADGRELSALDHPGDARGAAHDSRSWSITARKGRPRSRSCASWTSIWSRASLWCCTGTRATRACAKGVLQAGLRRGARARLPLRHHADRSRSSCGRGSRPMIRVLSVFGTRPEAIKMAPVVRALLAEPDRFESVVCVTAQHRAMLDQVLGVFDLQCRPRPRPDDARASRPPRSPRGCWSGCRLSSGEIRPDVLLVQGDTMTTFAAAFAAYLDKVPTGARRGRSADRGPVPAVSGGDEPGAHHAARRRSTSRRRVQARDRLLAEGVPADDVYLTGNTVIDALLQTVRPDYRFRTPALARARSRAPRSSS